ncbi:TetR/AcrR family transcriptional regulator [Fimbriiglobus ruber]|uniref:HTH tetR-type domain-containing protein n=1 Tax=Fimbriiglobus ruber TaxID=1908690 RepID=A0A225DKJ0_9BACT|nr:TetR/AcrR family transcriptional regulator [Fimbriiglobus ruber]OWK36667.1 hypothetical protein FRUB_09230 [Fimbriiglobus ruber]
MAERNGWQQTGPTPPAELPEVEGDSAAGPGSDVAIPPPDSAIARRRRDEIVTAAIEIIASEGLHNLSLARIERRIQMSRGQLTYYFPTKESILLAVFDRTLARMIEGAMADAEKSGAPKPGNGTPWECLKHGMTRMLSETATPTEPEARHQLHALVHTFMAQVRHRDDYRQKLATANAGLRAVITSDVAVSVPASPVPPAVVASIVMALIRGLSDQLAVDPTAFDRQQVADACLLMLAPLFGRAPEPPTPGVPNE